MPLEEAINHTATQSEGTAAASTAASQIAVFVSPRLTNEEIYLAQKFARVALGTHQVASLANLVNRDLACHDVVSTATYRDLENAQAIVVVGVADLRRALRRRPDDQEGHPQGAVD